MSTPTPFEALPDDVIKGRLMAHLPQSSIHSLSTVNRSLRKSLNPILQQQDKLSVKEMIRRRKLPLDKTLERIKKWGFTLQDIETLLMVCRDPAPDTIHRFYDVDMAELDPNKPFLNIRIQITDDIHVIILVKNDQGSYKLHRCSVYALFKPSNQTLQTLATRQIHLCGEMVNNNDHFSVYLYDNNYTSLWKYDLVRVRYSQGIDVKGIFHNILTVPAYAFFTIFAVMSGYDSSFNGVFQSIAKDIDIGLYYVERTMSQSQDADTQSIVGGSTLKVKYLGSRTYVVRFEGARRKRYILVKKQPVYLSTLKKSEYSYI